MHACGYKSLELKRVEIMLASVVIPTYKGAKFIPSLLRSLRDQSFEDFEVVIVVKPSGDGTENIVKKMCYKFDVRYRIVTQEDGFFTHALNLGIRHSRGGILLFTDDDAILPKNWINEHVNAHKRFPRMGAIAGHIINYDLDSGKSSRSDVEKPLVRSYRRFLLPAFKRPHPLFKDYQRGVYVTNSFAIAAGYGIPYQMCLSLPVRGVNMSFKRDAIGDARFPEHPLLKSAPNNEQYMGAQLVRKGYGSLFNPSIFVHHILRESLSRTRNAFNRYSILKPLNQYVGADHLERQIMRKLLGDLLENTKY